MNSLVGFNPAVTFISDLPSVLVATTPIIDYRAGAHGTDLTEPCNSGTWDGTPYIITDLGDVRYFWMNLDGTENTNTAIVKTFNGQRITIPLPELTTVVIPSGSFASNHKIPGGLQSLRSYYPRLKPHTEPTLVDHPSYYATNTQSLSLYGRSIGTGRVCVINKSYPATTDFSMSPSPEENSPPAVEFGTLELTFEAATGEDGTVYSPIGVLPNYVIPDIGGTRWFKREYPIISVIYERDEPAA